jgi:hypothetical protein
MSILSDLLAKEGKNIARQWAIESIPGIAKTISEKLGKVPLTVSPEELETLLKKPLLNTIKKGT